MAPKFGTSGLRGLVVELTDEVIGAHLRAFIASCDTGNGIWVARDLRESSPRIAQAVMAAAEQQGVPTTDAGDVPTPALALAAMGAGCASVMVTGSHIPADRNGLKFYLPNGEISKADEARIIAALDTSAKGLTAVRAQDTTSGPDWVKRYQSAFGTACLAGFHVGVWCHSAVSRDLLVQAFRALGADVTELGRSNQFVPIDTEAVSAADQAQFRAWFAEKSMDCIVSTDGDGDRPLLVAPNGTIILGDTMGQITSAFLQAETVVTPVSSNTGAEVSGHFKSVIRTKIGSPFVIAGMQTATGKVVGYEANGGFLLGFHAKGPAGNITPLPTRDSLLPLVASLVAARNAGGLETLYAQQPPRFTAADRLQEVPVERSLALVEALKMPKAQTDFLAKVGETPVSQDLTDGLRVTLASGRIWHMRPSGNAPEFRLYIEAESETTAKSLLGRGLDLLKVALG